MRKNFIYLLVMVLANACSWEDNETFYRDAENCDTVDVSYSTDIVPVLTNNRYACHSNANAPDFGSGIALENYEDVFASSTLIVKTINHSEGVSAMPKGSEKLDDCTISTFEAWVEEGALEN